MLVHMHSLEELRRLMGSRADHLLHMAGRGSHVAIGLVERHSGAEGKWFSHEGRTVLGFVMTIGHGRWDGAVLTVDDALPETLLDSMEGRPLGAVVSGAGCEGHEVLTARIDEGGTRIAIAPVRIDTADLQAPPPGERLRLLALTVRAYFAAPAYRGLGDGMSDVIMATMVMMILMTAVLTVGFYAPRIGLWAGAMGVAAAAGCFLMPRSRWRDWMRWHARGRPRHDDPEEM